MKQGKTIDARFIGYTTVAMLMGMGLAAAVGASAAGRGVGYDAVERGNCDASQHEAVEQVLEAGDYDAWVALMEGHGRITDVVTEDNFDVFIEMHEAMEDGLVEKAQELREDLGLGMHPQDGSGYRGQYGEGEGRHAGAMHRGMGLGDGTNSRWGGE